MLYIVIMSGGSGTRFWPASRKSRPKQLLPLLGGDSLLQRTVKRVLPAVPKQNILIITNEKQLAETQRQCASLIDQDNIIAEPEGRDTAPCIGLAATLLKKRDPNAVLAVLPADHLIEPAADFCQLLQAASQHAIPGRVITLGAKPTYPATGFGYIEKDQPLNPQDQHTVFKVRQFKEKPGLDTAKTYLEAGNYLWNCGIFIWRADTIVNELETHEPEMAQSLNQIVNAWGTEQQAATLKQLYPTLNKISIDYAVLEKCSSITVMDIDFSWNDLGSWAAFDELYEKDDRDNAVVDATHINIESSNCLIVGNGKTVATIGVSDLYIVQTEDAVLICRKGKEQQVKQVVDQLKQQGLNNLVD